MYKSNEPEKLLKLAGEVNRRLYQKYLKKLDLFPDLLPPRRVSLGEIEAVLEAIEEKKNG